MQENMNPGSITFDQSYARGLRASGTKMKRATDMTVDEVQVGARERSDACVRGADWFAPREGENCVFLQELVWMIRIYFVF